MSFTYILHYCILMLNIYLGDLESFIIFSRIFANIYLWFVRFYTNNKTSIIRKNYEQDCGCTYIVFRTIFYTISSLSSHLLQNSKIWMWLACLLSCYTNVIEQAQKISRDTTFTVMCKSYIAFDKTVLNIYIYIYFITCLYC